jgi:glyoxylase-like metal-dependent hydrolase (beta-lactamase superfamily II)
MITLTLEHGGRRIELIYAGRCHSDNSLMIHCPARRLLFAVDFVPVDSRPFRTLNDRYANEWVAALRWIEDNLDFDILVPGHGRLGT